MFRKLICLILVSLLFYQCSTVQLVSTKKIMDIPVSTGNGIGNYREFPKDLNRSPYWYKDTNEEAVKV